MIGPKSGRSATAFTVLEITLALGVLVAALVLVARVGLESMRSRARNAARHQAEEQAANALEAARACSWETLTPEWAAAQSLPTNAGSLDTGRFTVRVTPDADRPHLKRVTVTVSWMQDGGKQARPVELVGLFSSRTAAVKEEQP